MLENRQRGCGGSSAKNLDGRTLRFPFACLANKRRTLVIRPVCVSQCCPNWVNYDHSDVYSWLPQPPYFPVMDCSSTEISEIKEHRGVEQAGPLSRKLRVSCFVFADRLFQALARWMTVLHEGFWLGWLSADDLNTITGRHFDQSNYYASSEHNLSGFFDWEKPLINRYFRPGSRILVAGAGGGREVLALRKDGFDAEGFECSPPLVHACEKISSELGEPCRVAYCAADRVPQGPASYDGLLVGWVAYMHIPTKARRVLFLKALRQRARSQSPVVISFFMRNTNLRNDVTVYRAAKFFTSFRPSRREELELGDHLDFGRFFHSFTREEIEEEMKAAGLRVLELHEQSDSGQAVGMVE